jgi:hypothetical protein
MKLMPASAMHWEIRSGARSIFTPKADKSLCASQDGCTLHAATRAGALDTTGREALLRYVLRPPIAQDKIEQRPDGLVRIILKKPYADGTVAVDLDPLSLLTRLAASVPPPRHHTVRLRRRPRCCQSVASAYRALPRVGSIQGQEETHIPLPALG